MELAGLSAGSDIYMVRWLSRAQSAAHSLGQVRVRERTGSPASGRAPRLVIRGE